MVDPNKESYSRERTHFRQVGEIYVEAHARHVYWERTKNRLPCLSTGAEYGRVAWDDVRWMVRWGNTVECALASQLIGSGGKRLVPDYEISVQVREAKAEVAPTSYR